MRGKSLILFLFVILLATSVLAYSQIEATAVNKYIEFGEIATYTITIHNTEDYTQTYSFFSTAGVDWSVSTAPNANRKLMIGMNKTGSMDIEIMPLERFKPTIYLVPLKIESDHGEFYTENLEVYFGPSSPQEYSSILSTSVDVNENINPQEIQSIKIFIHNRNPRNYSGLVVKIQSDLKEFEKEQTLNLRPSESKTLEFTIEPNPYTQPKEYYLFFTIEQNGEIIKTFNKKITILSLTPEFTEEVTETKSFLKTVRVITFTNDGNVRNHQTAKIKMGALTDLITSTDPNAYTYKDETGRYLAWDRELGINEDFTVTITTSYRIPLILLILLIVGSVLYFIYKSPIAVTKSASNVIIHEGGVSGLKITLVVRNLSSKVIKDVEVFDTAPSITSVEKDVETGTIKPIDILQSRTGGILLKWKISELEGHEERLITYKVKSKLDIVGTILLPRSKVKYKVGKSQRTAYSNQYRVGTNSEE